jgi:hypothetical protein
MILFYEIGEKGMADAGYYGTVLYNNVHNRYFFGYGFYLQWGISTQVRAE